MIDTSKLNTGCIGRKVAIQAGAVQGVRRLVDWNKQGVCVLDDSVPGGERWIAKEAVKPLDPLPKTTALEPRQKGFWR